jgi:hypothetical protein
VCYNDDEHSLPLLSAVDGKLSWCVSCVLVFRFGGIVEFNSPEIPNKNDEKL